MVKIERKHFVFKASIAGIKTGFLINNSSEAELINESFVHTQKINTFKLKMKIVLTLGNKEVVQKLDSTCLIDIHIGNYHKKILCYVATFDVYGVVLGDS